MLLRACSVNTVFCSSLCFLFIFLFILLEYHLPVFPLVFGILLPWLLGQGLKQVAAQGQDKQ